MFYFTGDLHGEFARFTDFEGKYSPKEGDYLFVCGDFGFVFWDSEEEARLLDLLARRPYTVCFCDGNHENFPVLSRYPEEVWMGGRVRRIRKNLLWLQRGQIFDIEGKTFYVMGGAYSIDRALRIPGRTWWPEELPTAEEISAGAQRLMDRENRVDYILSHTAPPQIIQLMGETPDEHDERLLKHLNMVAGGVEFSHWYFGHWHTDRDFGRFHGLWFRVLTDDEGSLT